MARSGHARIHQLRLAALFVTLAVCGEASAQSTAQFPVRFDFLAPGARSMAVAGAFVAAADDATAAFTNPAGLAFLARFEVSFEGRYRKRETPYLVGGRISGSPTGMGLDTIPNPVYRNDVDRQVGATFVSVMVPAGTRLTLTGYRHDVAKVDNTFLYEGVFQRMTAFTTVDEGRDNPLGGRRAAHIVNYGSSLGYRVNNTLAIGVGASVYTFRLDSSFARYGFRSDAYGPIETRFVSATATQESSDSSLAMNGGVLWRPVTSLRIGLAYRRGPQFTFRQLDRELSTEIEVARQGRFKVPDVLAAGMSWRALNRDAGVLRILLEYDRVQYSQLKKDFINFQAIATHRESQLRLDDVNELHAGAEYRVLRLGGRPVRREIVLRGGTWFEPDHTVRYVPKAIADEQDILLSATLPGGSNVMHFTAGAGIQWSRLVNVSAAADLSAQSRHATVSIEVIIPKQ